MTATKLRCPLPSGSSCPIFNFSNYSPLPRPVQVIATSLPCGSRGMVMLPVGRPSWGWGVGNSPTEKARSQGVVLGLEAARSGLGAQGGASGCEGEGLGPEEHSAGTPIWPLFNHKGLRGHSTPVWGGIRGAGPRSTHQTQSLRETEGLIHLITFLVNKVFTFPSNSVT